MGDLEICFHSILERTKDFEIFFFLGVKPKKELFSE